MVEKLIEFCAKNRFIVFLLVFGLAAGGFWAMRNTPIDALPDLSDTQVIVYQAVEKLPTEAAAYPFAWVRSQRKPFFRAAAAAWAPPLGAVCPFWAH
ncbi:hypothetical protein [Methylococcus capsulatus]|uniref:hypothetical protein n=1 Tax=Methylococcus capsulatus TaxID=414 RepID=UPI00211B121B|nr:hypothetical protein [Methylococcus capsulatus]